MNIKALIETLTELPDLQLIHQLIRQISNKQKLILSDPKKLFHLILVILSHESKEILLTGYILVNVLTKRLLGIYIENGWGVIGKKVIELLGSEDGEVRKRSQEIILLLIKLTENPEIYLDTLLRGTENTTPLRLLQCIRILPKLLSLYPKILHNKKSINVVKTLIEKVISFTTHKITNIERESKNTLIKMYHIKLESLEEVILRLDPGKAEELHKVWEKEIEGEILGETEEGEEDLRFDHFPMINSKVFGVIDPTLITNLLTSPDPQEKTTSLISFSLSFSQHFPHLSKYPSLLNRLLLSLLPLKQPETLTMLHQLYSLPNIKNRLQLTPTILQLLHELAQEKASWRQLIRSFIIEALLPLDSPLVMNLLEKSLTGEIEREGEWFKMHEILVIYGGIVAGLEGVEWPRLDGLVGVLGEVVGKSKVVKVKKEGMKVLAVVLGVDSRYRERMEGCVGKEVMEVVKEYLREVVQKEGNQFMEEMEEGEGAKSKTKFK